MPKKKKIKKKKKFQINFKKQNVQKKIAESPKALAP